MNSQRSSPHPSPAQWYQDQVQDNRRRIQRSIKEAQAARRQQMEDEARIWPGCDYSSRAPFTNVEGIGSSAFELASAEGSADHLQYYTDTKHPVELEETQYTGTSLGARLDDCHIPQNSPTQAQDSAESPHEPPLDAGQDIAPHVASETHDPGELRQRLHSQSIEVEKLKKQVKSAFQKIGELNDALEKAHNDVKIHEQDLNKIPEADKIRDYIERLSSLISEKNKELQNLRGQLAESQEREKQLTAKLRLAEKEIQRLQEVSEQQQRHRRDRTQHHDEDLNLD